MKKKSAYVGSLVAGIALTAIHLWFAKSPVSKSHSIYRDYEDIDDYIEKQMERLKIPGASLAIVKEAQIVHLRGFGQARPRGETPTALTPFFIGSLTKSFTALAVMQLVEAGKVELDAPVQRYLPWFRVADPEASSRMTVRHLLNQTSGLPTMAGEVILKDFGDDQAATERKVRAMATLKTNPVGEKCAYCNLNYDILGLIVETISGETYPDYIQSHIFNPLKMDHSYSNRAVAKQNGLASGHRLWFSFPFPTQDIPIQRASLPSGYFISCAQDMANYLIAHLNGGRFGKTQVLSSTGIDELHQGAVQYFAMGKEVGKYGMGWFENDLGRTKIYSHSGNVPDFSAYMALVPEQMSGLVILFNSDPYGLPPITEEIGMGMTALLAGQQPAAIKLNFVQWIVRLLPLIPILQVVGIINTFKRADEWQKNPRSQPDNINLWTKYVLLPLIPNLSLATLLLYARSTGLLGFLHYFMPDLAWIIRISGGIAGIWAILRTNLLLARLQKP